ncbi:hypothetical protein [Polynucleobacter sinensis]|jgi:hypothetical protein|uniref:hypothetical protein n=1 Tax=Polynucleobacter sinensis TaxID=1743157 RepID=UPI0007849905|nr:hypothetical protein [Polynucleobacter sinensis]
MKFKKSDYLYEDDSHVDLQGLDNGSIDHTGILVASLSALIIILIAALSSDIDLISLYFSR